jgi:iduronate 2-sulfatase
MFHLSKRYWFTLCVMAMSVFQGSVDGSDLPSAQAPDSSPKNAKIKNVLLIIADDLKASVLGCYGDKVAKTPNIDALARQGVVFDRAYCQHMWCAPSRQSFMFSRYQGNGPVNIGQHFIRNGWYSARVGKIYHMRVPGDIIAGTNGNDVASSWTERFNSAGQEAHTPGDYACLNLDIFTDGLANRESTQMKHRMFVTVEQSGDGTDQPDHKSATKAIELLNKHQSKPFFLAVGFVRPHYPMVAPQKLFADYPWQDIELPEIPVGDMEDIPAAGRGKTRSDRNSIGKYPDNQKRMWAGYYASTAFVDRQVGRIMAELERLGLRDSTAVVFCSDHGYHLGEHQFWQKSNLHEEVTRVPLIVSAPGFQSARSQSLVELVDLFPTFCELAEVPIPNSVQGKSLLPVLKEPTANVRSEAFYSHDGHGLRTDRWAFMRYRDNSQELYDMENDPKQFKNLVQLTEYAETVKELSARLDLRIQAAGIKNKVKQRKAKQSNRN